MRELFFCFVKKIPNTEFPTQWTIENWTVNGEESVESQQILPSANPALYGIGGETKKKLTDNNRRESSKSEVVRHQVQLIDHHRRGEPAEQLIPEHDEHERLQNSFQCGFYFMYLHLYYKVKTFVWLNAQLSETTCLN